mmetsp:Transcript_51260/g.122880  ORF Transcript_51260/g.122880 Transcript_51260/m.122880 type:complete len:561 (+) Transcript_51260:71-1753(+)
MLAFGPSARPLVPRALQASQASASCTGSYSTSLGGRGLWQGLGLRGVLTGALATAVARRSRRGLNFGARRLASVSASKREYDFDLFTIGGGSGGVRGSRWAAMQYGAKVALAELPFAIVSTKHEAGGLGGTCVIRGCVPKKLLIYGSHLREDIQDGRGYGWSLPEGVSPSLDWDKLIEAKNAEVTRLNGIYQKLLDGAGVKHFEGYARIVDPHTVEVNGERHTAKYICVATGGRATRLPIPGKNLPGVLTSDEALALPKRPDKLVIIGGGYIAVEFAGYFHGYGTEVHLVFRQDKPLRGFDEDIREHLMEMLKAKGIHVHAGESPYSIEEEEGKLKFRTDTGTELFVDNVMFATGRKPNSQELGLEEAGVKTDPKSGKILVDEYSRTNVESIFAIGDVTERIALTPVALMEGMAMAKTMFGEGEAQPDYENVPSAVFSQPPCGSCGLTEAEAAKKYGSVDVYVTKFKPMKHTMPTGRGEEEKIMMKLICVSEGVDQAGKVVGAHMVGAEAGEMMQGIGVAMKAGASKAHFDATVGIHPTSAEEWCTMRTKTRTTTSSDVE